MLQVLDEGSGCLWMGVRGEQLERMRPITWSGSAMDDSER